MKTSLVFAMACLAWPAAAGAQSSEPQGAGTREPATSSSSTSADDGAASGSSETEAGGTARTERRHHRRRASEPGGRDFDLLWFGAEVGAAIVDLKMISYDQLLPEEIDVKESGLGFGAAAGLKVKFLSVGLHLAVAKLSAFDIWALNLDGQLRIPLDFLEPYIRVGLGYAFLGAFSGQVSMKGVDVDGWDLQAGFGMDLYPAHFFSIGAGADFTILNLTRTDSVTAVDLTQDGAAVGLAVLVQAKAALHF